MSKSEHPIKQVFETITNNIYEGIVDYEKRIEELELENKALRGLLKRLRGE